MPGAVGAVAGSGTTTVEQTIPLDFERLRQCLQSASSSQGNAALFADALDELRNARSQIAEPLSIRHVRRPDATVRAQLSGTQRARLNDPSGTGTSLEVDGRHIAAALALSTELCIYETDAVFMLVRARAAASHRADNDVVAAARARFFANRRQSVCYLQEILRAPLAQHNGDLESEEFLKAVVNERDVLVTEFDLFGNVLSRLEAGIRAASRGESNTPDCLSPGETVLLAECLFLLAYTVQLMEHEALALRAFLNVSVEFCNTLSKRQENATLTQPNNALSVAKVGAESVRNLIVLAWICALDRSRYQDVYNPRTGESNVNLLLTDVTFIGKTVNIPPLLEGEDDKVQGMDRAIMAAELAASVFRLAVALPDQDEAIQTAIRVSAFGNALSFLSQDLPTWIETGAGSLCPDADLYSDALEDLALDIAEAPNLVSSFIQFTLNEVTVAASDAAIASFESTPSPRYSLRMAQPPYPPPRVATSSAERKPLPGAAPLSTSAGKPPRPPSLRPTGLPPRPGNSNNPIAAVGNKLEVAGTPVGATRFLECNLIAQLAEFTARVIKLAPAKLLVDSIGNGPRYWVSVGPAGLIPRIGDAVIDLWDVCVRNPYAPGGVGPAFVESLKCFLNLLAASASKDGSPAHAASALRYLQEAGHPVVALHLACQALKHFSDHFSKPASPRGKSLEDPEVDALCGIIDVVAAAAEGVRDHGGIAPILGPVEGELSMRIASLAVHEVPPRLKASLISALGALNDHRSISLFLENVAVDNATPLRRVIRAYEGETGEYKVTLSILKLVEACTTWEEDEYPAAAIESIASWFAIDEVLLNWSRRKYASEAQRWGVVRAAASLLLELGHRGSDEERMLRIISRLLVPAPGTGAASTALRALIATCGLLRNPEDASRFLDKPDAVVQSGRSGQYMWGRSVMLHAASHGLGEAYREMERAVAVSARILSGLFEVPQSRVASSGFLVASVAELLVVEVLPLIAAASMVFSVDSRFSAAYKAGYSKSTCSAVLAMLATAAHYSQGIASLLARDPIGVSGVAASFRESLADIVSRGESGVLEETLAPSEPVDGVTDVESKNNSANVRRGKKKQLDPPIMHSALRLVEACLGHDGGSAPGLFLLGLQVDSAGRYRAADYGVLGALIELVAGTNASGSLDSKGRATAAVFVQRLAANTVRKTSRAVLEHIKRVGETDPIIRGGGFADEMLFRILEFANSKSDSGKMQEAADWASIGELLAACLSLSALQVRIFPEHEVERSAYASSQVAVEHGVNDQKNIQHINHAPSVYELFRLIVFIAGRGAQDVAFEAFQSWYCLVGVRVVIASHNRDFSGITMFLELVSTILTALGSSDAGNETGVLLKKDGGRTAAATVLTCVQHICDGKPQTVEAQQYIGELQAGALLTDVIRALAGLVGISADVARARTLLYTTLLQVGPLAEEAVTDEAIARAFGGRVGPRQVSGTEGVISVACIDAVSGPSAATRAVAMSAAAMVTTMDAVRAVPALSSQNRLRRVISATLADPETRNLIASSCRHSKGEMSDADSSVARERAASVVGEAALSLIHAISAAPNGTRVLVDAGCIDAVASLLWSLNSSRVDDYMESEDNAVSNYLRGQGNGEGMLVTSGSKVKFGEEEDIEHIVSYEDGYSAAEIRASLVAAICSAVAAAMTRADAALVDGALVVLDKGLDCFSDIMRMVRSGKRAYLDAVGCLAMVLSRIPHNLLFSTAGPMHLRLGLASALGAFVAPRRALHVNNLNTISKLGEGLNRRRPISAAELKRLDIMHPSGGSLFERDLVSERVMCLQSILAAIRPPAGILYLFAPNLGNSSHREPAQLKGSAIAQGIATKSRYGDLADIARICKDAFADMQRFSDESAQMSSLAAGDTSASSLSAQKLTEIRTFCEEKYFVATAASSNDPSASAIAMSCLQTEAGQLRELADQCVSIFESTLFILREYMRSARSAVRGDPVGITGTGTVPMEGNTAEDSINEEEPDMKVEDAHALLDEAKASLLPLCKEIDALPMAAWGQKDAAFSKQLSRQLRSYIAR